VSGNGKKPVLKIRYRRPGKEFGTKFTLSRGSRRKRLKGRILSVKKLSFEETWKIGEYLPFNPEALISEFRREVASK